MNRTKQELIAVREKRSQLQRDVKQLLVDFEDETGLTVDDIEMLRTKHLACANLNGELAHVTIEVKL